LSIAITRLCSSRIRTGRILFPHNSAYSAPCAGARTRRILYPRAYADPVSRFGDNRPSAGYFRTISSRSRSG